MVQLVGGKQLASFGEQRNVVWLRTSAKAAGQGINKEGEGLMNVEQKIETTNNTPIRFGDSQFVGQS